MASLLKNSTLMLLLVILSLGVAGYYYTQNQNTQKELAQIKKNPNIVAQNEAKDLVSKVEVLVSLPKGETPTIATVVDASKLKGQVFFQNAKNGDKMLIYTTAKKAYLYSVSLNKILDVAPLNITNNQNPAEVAGVKTETPSPSPAPKK